MLLIVAGDVAVFVLLFLVLESGYRIYRDGVRGTLSRVMSGEPAPYSNLGTGRWVVFDPDIGYRLNPESEHINSRSIRGPEIAVPKPAGTFRLVVLGDSIPWDHPGFVDEITEQLKSRGAVEVINASVPGYTAFQEFAFFKRYVADTNPDLVIWCYCLNDNHKFLHRFDPEAHLLVTDEAYDSLRIHTWWDWVVSRSYVLTTIRFGFFRPAATDAASTFAWDARPDFNTAWKDYTWPAYEGYLREMVDLLHGHGSRLALVVFPYEPQVTLRGQRQSMDYILKPQSTLAALCRQYRVPYLDPYPQFARAYDNGARLYRDGIHFNPAGHHLIAAELMHFLDSERLVPPAPAG